jgi:transglutaminase-like putative cysteine protease
MIDSLRATAWTQVQQHWITALLLSAVMIAWLSMLSGVDRLRDAETIAAVAISGALYGALLALSRFRGRTALLIDAITSLSLTVLIAGRVLPDPSSLFAQPFDKSLWLMNARLATLGEVLRSDTQGLLTNYFPQTRLFLCLSVLAVWSAAAWLLWGVLRRRRAVAAVLPLAILGALVTALSETGPYLSVLYIAACVLLTARTAYTYQTREWNRRDVGFPDLIGEDWTAWAAVLSIAIVLLAGISTPEWRNAFQHLVESLRPPPPPAEQTAAPVQIRPQTSDNYLPSFVPRLDYVGDSFPVSDQTVFYVATDDPPAGVDSSGLARPPRQKHYWRGAIFDRYTGTGWEPLEVETGVPPPANSDQAGPGRYALTQQFDIISLQDNRLFATSQPVKASEGTVLQAARDEPTAVLPRGRTPRYEIISWAPRATAQALAAASTDYPAEIRARYLQSPDTMPQRVKDLAARLTQGAASPYDKALRLQEYLRVTYPYQLDVPAPPPGRDVADYFLFDAPGGFCSYYATAMAVMLRSQGVPARVVAGFATGEYDGLLRKYRVPARAAHAWVEVYFPTYGWIEFEPTSSQAVFDYTGAETSRPNRLPESSQSQSTGAALTTIMIGALSALGLGLIGVTAYIVWRRYAQLRLAPEVQARRLYWEARRSLQQAGVETSFSTTPAEFRAACAERLAGQPGLQRAIGAAAELYIRAVFTSTPPDRSEVAVARRLWRATWRQRLLLKLRLYARHLRGHPAQFTQRDR